MHPGDAYVVGYTTSTNFPTANAIQPTNHGAGDAFVAKLNATGSTLVYSTYLGGTARDYGRSIAVDGADNAYVTGYTASVNFPTANPLQPTNHGGPSWCPCDGFVAKLSASGSALIYSTYLGGSSDDGPHGIAVDGFGNAYVTGETYSTDFPTVNAIQSTLHGDQDVFVFELNASGSALVYSTYLGGKQADFGYDIAVDGSGDAYVTGYTASGDFPTANPLQLKKKGGQDAFVAKLGAAGSGLVYSTYIGGTNDDEGIGIRVDGSGNAYVTGYTLSTDFPTADPLQATNSGGADAFLAGLSADGSTLTYSTYFGGSNNDYGRRIAVDGSGNVYLTGWTLSSDFPTANPLQATNHGLYDGFVIKIAPTSGPIAAPTFSPPAGTYNSTQTVTITDSTAGSIVYYTTDGSVPTANSTMYAGPITVSVSETVNAIAVAQGASGPVGTAAYVIGTPDFSLSATALTATTIIPGQSSTFTVTAPAAGGFSGSVALTCLVQPSPTLAPQCSLSPSSITPGTSANLTVSTTPASPGALAWSGGFAPLCATWLPLVGLVASGVRFRSGRAKGRLPAVVMACMLFAGLGLAVACGGSNSSVGSSKGTPAGTYTITLTGTSGALTHSATVTVTVQ